MAGVSIKQALREFRAETPGVQAIALTGLSTGTVFVSEAAVPMKQEAFDALAARARALLDGGAAPNRLAYEADATAARLFLRGGDGADEALLLILKSTDADPQALTDAAQSLIARIGPEAPS